MWLGAFVILGFSIVAVFFSYSRTLWSLSLCVLSSLLLAGGCIVVGYSLVGTFDWLTIITGLIAGGSGVCSLIRLRLIRRTNES